MNTLELAEALRRGTCPIVTGRDCHTIGDDILRLLDEREDMAPVDEAIREEAITAGFYTEAQSFDTLDAYHVLFGRLDNALGDIGRLRNILVAGGALAADDMTTAPLDMLEALFPPLAA